MALQILKDPAHLPDLEEMYYHHATVEVKRNTGLDRLLGRGIGSVSVSRSCDPADPVIQVVPPRWRGGEQEEWEILRQCYWSVLGLALRHCCDAIVLPLLAEDDPKFPAYIDHKLAVDTVQAFLENHSMDVYLLCTRRDPARISRLQTEVEGFLAVNWSGFGPPVGNAPLPPPDYWPLPPSESASFSAFEDRVSTAMPASCACEEAPMPMPSAGFGAGPLPGRAELEERLRATDAGFSETLLKIIDKTGKKDSEIYTRANVSRQHFSKIRNNPDYRPTKPTALAFAIALELDLEQTRDLIGRAGYALTNSSKFDVIIMYFIQNRNYNMFDINETLYEFDQSLLGA